MINSPVTGTFTANAVAGAIVVILGYVLGLLHPGTTLPPDVQMAGALVIGWLLSFVVHNPTISADTSEQKGFGTAGILTAMFLVGLILVMGVSACTSDGKLTFNAKQIDAKVTEQKALADLQWACFAMVGSAQIWNAVSPAVKQSVTGAQRTDAALAGIQGLCGGTAPTNVGEAIAKVKDATGMVAASLVAVGASPAQKPAT